MIGAPCVFPEPSQIAPWPGTGLLWPPTHSHPETQPSSLPCLQMGKLRLPPGHQLLWAGWGPHPRDLFLPKYPSWLCGMGRGHGGAGGPPGYRPYPGLRSQLCGHTQLCGPPSGPPGVLECTGGGRRGGRRLLQRPLPASLQGPELPPASPLCEVAGRGPLPGPPASSGERPESPVHPQRRLAGPSTSEMQIRP